MPHAASLAIHRRSQRSPRSYRCHYHPKDRNGFPAACDTGVLPFVQVKARDAEHAQRVAKDLTGCSISNVEHLDEVVA
jgi:hypothetical protein